MLVHRVLGDKLFQYSNHDMVDWSSIETDSILKSVTEWRQTVSMSASGGASSTILEMNEHSLQLTVYEDLLSVARGQQQNLADLEHTA